MRFDNHLACCVRKRKASVVRFDVGVQFRRPEVSIQGGKAQ